MVTATDPVVRETVRRIGGHRTRLLRVDGDGPTVLLLHGFTDSADTWRRVLDRLAAAGQAAVAVDLPSHGSATRLDPHRRALPQLVAFAGAVLDGLDAVTPVTVVGNSLGGAVALGVASADARVGSVVLLGSAGFAYPPILAALHTSTRTVAPGADRLMGGVPRRLVGHAFAAVPDALASAAFTEVVRWVAVEDRHRMSRSYRSAYRAHLKRPQTGRGLLQLARRLPYEVAPSAFDLAAVDATLVAMWGSRDRICPPSGAELLRAARPDAQITVLAGVGHLIQIEAPRQVTDTILATCRRQDPTP